MVGHHRYASLFFYHMIYADGLHDSSRCGKQGFQSPPDKNFTFAGDNSGNIAGNWGYEVSRPIPALTVESSTNARPSAACPIIILPTQGTRYRTISQLRPSRSSEISWWGMLAIARRWGSHGLCRDGDTLTLRPVHVFSAGFLQLP